MGKLIGEDSMKKLLISLALFASFSSWADSGVSCIFETITGSETQHDEALIFMESSKFDFKLNYKNGVIPISGAANLQKGFVWVSGTINGSFFSVEIDIRSDEAESTFVLSWDEHEEALSVICAKG